ncbi:hypothetical protein [Pseudohongiella sp.]|uniref:TonB C-terminal domain-containing protein n=1 Tax=marine sediment metagenome TaxID=412755 RepID=A0A0F9Z2Z1_9ZZZZ|nr:hypothetical protein [Pseudohongiella sp.]HDZ09294.1 hypothetical protein [Pseudohongiella sp.]HEA62158.1 hypothetical protein [Pseudohongiella sp.]
MPLTHLNGMRRPGRQFLHVFCLAAGMLLPAAATASVDSPFTDDRSPAEPGLTTSSLATQVEHLNILRERVAMLQSRQGLYHPGLLNAMNGLSEALISVGELREANNIVEQQIQILRVNDGLYTDGQIALVHRQLSIMAAQQNWVGMQDRLVYLSWLLERSNTLSDSEKINNIKVMRDWTRLLLSRGPRQQEAAYLFQLRDMEESALALARQTTTEPAVMQGLIYDHALAELNIALGIIDGSDTSQQLINRTQGLQTNNLRAPQRMTSVQDIEATYGARTSTVVERAHRTAMMRHFVLIKELESTLLPPTDQEAGDLTSTDPEAAAMLQLYLGDSVLLRQQYELRIGAMAGPDRGQSSTGSAHSYYQSAWELFLQAGYSSEQLNARFSCPALLPLPTFSSRLEDSSNDCEIVAGNRVELPATALVQDGIPGLRYQAMPGNSLMSQAAGISATINFNIGVNGQAARTRVMSAEPDSTSARIRGRDGLHDLQFRPALRDGKAVSTENASMTVFCLEPG